MTENKNVALSDEVPPEVEALHQVTFELVEQLNGGKDGTPFSASEEVLGGLAQYLLSKAEDPELLHMVDSLHALAISLKEQKSPDLSQQLEQILKHESVQVAVKKLKVSADPEKVASTAKKFSSFADKDSPTAPKVGEAKPEGSISLDKLNFPKRL